MARKRKPGRPSKLTPSVILMIALRRRAVVPLKTAVRSAGVLSYGTFCEWKRTGEDEYLRREGDPRRERRYPRLTTTDLEHLATVPAAALPDDIDAGNRLYLALYEEVERANAEALVALVATARNLVVPHDQVRHHQVVDRNGKEHDLVEVRKDVVSETMLRFLMERAFESEFGSSALNRNINFDLAALTVEELEIYRDVGQAGGSERDCMDAILSHRLARGESEPQGEADEE